MNPQDLRNLMEAYGQVYEAKETTALGGRLIDPYDKDPYSDDRKPAGDKYKPVRKLKKQSGVVKKEETEIEEATAMAKRGHDETKLRKRAGGGEAADRATALENKPTYGDAEKAKQRSDYARKQRGDFRNTASSSPGLHGYGHKSDDPKVKAKQAARGAQRGALTPNERKQLNREEVDQIQEVLDTPEKANEYARKNVKSMVGAFVKGAVNKDLGQLKTIEKRGRGAAMAKRKAEKHAAEEQNEGFDIYDIVLEFLYVEGYAETLEEAAWMMANELDAEDIQEILEEVSPETKKWRAERAKRLDYKDEVRAARREWIRRANKGRPEYEGVKEEYMDEAEGSYGKTPKARQAMGKLAIARREKPVSEYGKRDEKTKKVKAIEKHTHRIDNGPNVGNRGKRSTPPRYSGGRGKMDQDARDYGRADSAEYGSGTHGSGTVTKNPKKLRKQKAIGEIGEAYQEPKFSRKDYLAKLEKRGGMGAGTKEDPHGYRDPKMAKVGAEFSKRVTAAMKAKRSGEADTYKAEKEAQSKNK